MQVQKNNNDPIETISPGCYYFAKGYKIEIKFAPFFAIKFLAPRYLEPKIVSKVTKSKSGYYFSYCNTVRAPS